MFNDKDTIQRVKRTLERELFRPAENGIWYSKFMAILKCYRFKDYKRKKFSKDKRLKYYV